MQSQRPPQSQRERLLDAMIELAAREGSQNVSVAQVSSRAGVSSATFYEQFENKEECMLAAYREAAGRLLVLEPPTPNGQDWTEAAQELIGEVGRAVEQAPDAARLLFIDTLSGGPRAREARATALGAFERRVQEFIDSAVAGGNAIDVPAIALVGAVRSVVARHLRTHSESRLQALAADGVAWVLSYAVPAGRTPWSTGPGALLPLATPRARRNATAQTKRLPRGRHRLPPGVIARSHRTRIIYGTAEVMRSKGYTSATVADIVAAAGVSRDVFYEHFSGKQHAFLEAQNHPTQHILQRCAGAYFGTQEWPVRVWNLLRTLLSMIAENPAISHLRLVECYAAGTEAIRRAEDITRSFTIFLEEGYGYRREAGDLPAVCTQAIAGAVFEMVQRGVARQDLDELQRILPRLTYVCIAPFMGPLAAREFLQEQVRQERRHAERSRETPAEQT